MRIPLTILASALTGNVLADLETVVSPEIESVGLFKNGLAVVRITFPVDGPGLYRWDKVPRVVHGSLWMESDGLVTTRSTTRMIEETQHPTGQLQHDLAGKPVDVTLRHPSANNEVIAGTVWKLPEVDVRKAWNKDYSSLNPNNGSFYWTLNQQRAATMPRQAQPSSGSFLILESEGSRRYIDRSSIASVSVGGPFKPVTRQVEKAVLIFDVDEVPADGGTVRISYLTKGLAWLPSYRVDLSDPETLKIQQSALIRNEMDDLQDTEIQLISGYPNVRFGAVDSPIWPGTSLAAFFQQVGQSGQISGGVMSNSIVSNQMIYSNSSSPSFATPLPDVPEEGRSSDDIHYESIGRHNMTAGDSLSLEVAHSRTPYERVVEWTVPDPRDERGRYHRDRSRALGADDQPWDAVRFDNPFSFPMTTASALVTEDGKFRGQSLSTWVNPGQQTCLRITRALSVRTESGEIEEEGEREIVWIAGNDYQRTTVKGRLSIQNFRGEDVTTTIRCEFSGKLIEAEGDPEKSLRTEGVASVNPRRQLDWTVKLDAGEERELVYRYQVLVDR